MERARRYVAWVALAKREIFVASLILLAVAIDLVAFHLPLTADLADLLPDSAPSVVDLHRLEARLVASDTVLVIVDAPDREGCASATEELTAAVRAIGPQLVVRVDGDQADARAFLWTNRFMLTPLADLARAADALTQRLAAARLSANPLYVDLAAADRVGDERAAKQTLADLRARRRDIEATLHRPSNVSDTGRRALLEVRAAMPATDIARGKLLLDALTAARERVAAHHPGLAIGVAGDLVTAIAEHDAIVGGTLVSGIVTSALVGLVLALFFRSVRLLALLIGTVGFATLVAFATAAFTVGRLNVATAFLGAIIAGNGINYGILLLARFLEHRRTEEVEPSLAGAIVETIRPTAIASLGAAIAYASLAATSFRGFADFAIIGATGMILCWIASYVLLPALVLQFARRSRAAGHPRLERALVRALGARRPRLVACVGLVVTLGAIGVVVRYVAADPFEYDMRALGSVGEATETEQHWMRLAESTFGRGRAGRTFIAVDRAAQIAPLVAALSHRKAIGSVQSILDVVPEHQGEKRALLAAIRATLDDPLLDELDDEERAELRELRPPDTVATITRESLPPSIVALLAERSGRLGYLVSVRPADDLDELDGHDVIRFATAIREVQLPHGEVLTTSGASVIFADILATIAADGPRVTLFALCGIGLMLVLVLGLTRRAAVVLGATISGAVLMVATCAALGLKVNFLDFVALPITLGLGVDYAINIAEGGSTDAIGSLRERGPAVLICSLTTMIGYGSLLVSSNLAIRGFGRASLIGEVTAVLAALVLVPALLAIWPARYAR